MPNPTDHGRDYLVAPRFLANPTYTGDAALVPLLDAGWTLSHDELGNTYVTAPDFTVRVGYLPEGNRGDLWMIAAHDDVFAPATWQMLVDLAAPPEIVAELTTALAAAHSASPASVVHGPTGGFGLTGRLLDEHGWQQKAKPPLAAFQSPDRLITLHRRLGHLGHNDEMTGDRERWTFVVGPPGHQWYATATSDFPDRFLDTLTTSITNPAPVQRYLRRSELARLPAQATATPVAPSPLEVARMKAATSRSLSVPRTAPAPRAGGSVLAYTTATRPVALPKPAPSGRAR
ncbi:DUF317 domain-containing protein [Kitasatospora phosalacinea]|uniref:DUF317 domain-containing protein n=1 Tax=Kitasatospora phosalacinea TaxID=2065 RepID=A0A9W6URY9_9ACTN|nr:DUF317 domain-containing protein [Kitasatospora phosalacinea]GLW58018.1 hypothetical protein Kpho01_60290 [Kitasatospora phosalacinea]